MCGAIAFVEGLGEHVQRAGHTTGVVFPHRVNRPEMVRRQHAAQACHGWDGRSETGLGVEAERSTVPRIEIPEGWCDVLVRSRHLHAAWSDGGGPACGG